MKTKTLLLLILMAATLGARNDAGSWATRAPLTSLRGSTMAADVGGRLYVAGGFDGTSFLTGYQSTHEVYDPATDTWAARAPMPTARALPGSASIGGIVYVVGGWNILVPGTYHALDTVEAYDPASDTWTTKAPMPTPRFGMAIAVLGGKLYTIGGSAGAASLSDVESYDPVTNTWTTLAPVPGMRYEPSAGAIGGRIYVSGYDLAGNGIGSTTVAYDPASNMWSPRAPMPTNRYGAGYGVVNGRLVVAGGVWSGYTSAVESYDPVSDSWSTLAPLPTQRNEPISGVAGGVLYVIGGYSPVTNMYTTVNEAFAVNVAPPPETASSLLASLASQFSGIGGGSFASELNSVRRALGAGQTNAGCGSLNGFANHVRAQAGKQLSAAQAESALATVARIRALAGCR